MITKIDDHPIYCTVMKLIKIKTGIDLEPDSAKCDEVFSEYLLKSKNHCNKDYIQRLIKFVLLFREALNITLGDKLKLSNDEDYSSNYTAEDAPEISNEFITEYLEVDSFLLGFGREEAIELTMNFCQWMYDNNFTCSKLTIDA